jgi:hypothetical protein
LGPISLTYKGKGTFVERNEKEHKVVIEASGRDSRGNGTASATVTGTLHADSDDQTTVKMVTDMTVTGRPAQFGRGVMADVSDKIVGQFSSCLATKLGPGEETAAVGDSAPAGKKSAPGTAEPSPAPAKDPAPSGEAPKVGSAGVATATATPAAAGSASSNGAAPIKQAAAATEPTRSEVDAIDLLDTAGAPVLKRVAPVAVGVLLLIVLWRLLKGRKS